MGSQVEEVLNTVEPCSYGPLDNLVTYLLAKKVLESGVNLRENGPAPGRFAVVSVAVVSST